VAVNVERAGCRGGTDAPREESSRRRTPNRPILGLHLLRCELRFCGRYLNAVRARVTTRTVTAATQVSSVTVLLQPPSPKAAQLGVQDLAFGL